MTTPATTDVQTAGLAVLDERGYVLFVNEVALRLLGRRDEELLDRVFAPAAAIATSHHFDCPGADGRILVASLVPLAGTTPNCRLLCLREPHAAAGAAPVPARLRHDLNNALHLVGLNVEYLGDLWRGLAPLLTAHADPSAEVAHMPVDTAITAMTEALQDVDAGTRRLQDLLAALVTSPRT